MFSAFPPPTKPPPSTGAKPDYSIESNDASLEVDLEEFPDILPDEREADQIKEITIGDLHGNALKLLHIMIKENFIKGISKEDYDKFVKLYTQDTPLVKSDIDLFKRIIDGIELSNPNILFRLIGDELADRGANDYFTLKIIGKISSLIEKDKDHGSQLEINASNHGLMFMRNMEEMRLGNIDQYSIPDHDHYDFYRSMMNLQPLIDEGLVTQQEIYDIYDNHYVPRLNLVSTSYIEDMNAVFLHMHSRGGLANISYLANLFKVDYDDSTPEKLSETVKAINDIYRKEYVEGKKVQMIDHFEPGSIPSLDTLTPYGTIFDGRNDIPLDSSHPFYKYLLYYSNGHDKNFISDYYRCNLDKNNVLGNAMGANGNLKGYYGCQRLTYRKPELKLANTRTI